MELNDELISYCKELTPIEMLYRLTKGNIRGLDMIAVKNLSFKKRMADDVFNLLLGYFYDEFGSTVYNRNDFGRVYLYWVRKKVITFSQAIEMTKIDIKEILKR
jgi:replication initiation and membrane attachment protein DnaB